MEQTLQPRIAAKKKLVLKVGKDFATPEVI
jgi:hypothetical protein